MEVNEQLITWYLTEKRDLPWRNTKDPYKIWLSEIILQQTRVEQGLEYYLRFVNTFPTIGLLAKADEEQVLKLWQGLGYYSRARNLHTAAKYVDSELGGIFPAEYDTIINLKGVGPYTAAAIASFAFKEAKAVVDGNVFRVLSRLFDIKTPINSTEGRKEFQNLADGILNQSKPDIHNQAIMELGALICKPTNPKCDQCPVQSKCLGFAKKTVKERPIKLKKTKVSIRKIDYVVVEGEDHLLMRKRSENDIWQGLYDFISLENREDVNSSDVVNHVQTTIPEIGVKSIEAAPFRSYKHLLSHRKIEARFWRLKVSGTLEPSEIYKVIPKAKIGEVAVPRLIHKFLEDSELL